MNKVYIVSGYRTTDQHAQHTQLKASSQNCKKRLLLLRNTTSNEKCTQAIRNSSQKLTTVSKRPTDLSQISSCGWEQKT